MQTVLREKGYRVAFGKNVFLSTQLYIFQSKFGVLATVIFSGYEVWVGIFVQDNVYLS